MPALASANVALRFLLELGALAALAFWGVRTHHGPLVKVGFGVGAPLLAAVVWGTFVAPRAPASVPASGKVQLGLIIFGLSAAALAAAGQAALAWSFGAVVVLNQAVLLMWGD